MQRGSQKTGSPRSGEASKLIPTLAILGIVAIELVAISRGIDGIAVTASVASISGIGGYYWRRYRETSTDE